MIRLFLASLAALLFTACAGQATVRFDDPKDPARVTSVSGLKSHDAANVMTYGAYTDAKVKKPQRAVCSLKAQDGKELKIEGLSEFTCWAPDAPGDTVARPVQAEGELMQAARAVREGVGGTVKDVTPALAIGAAVKDRQDARAAATRQAEIQANSDVELETLRSQERQASRQDPIILTIPEGGSASVLRTD